MKSSPGPPAGKNTHFSLVCARRLGREGMIPFQVMGVRLLPTKDRKKGKSLKARDIAMD